MLKLNQEDIKSIDQDYQGTNRFHEGEKVYICNPDNEHYGETGEFQKMEKNGLHDDYVVQLDERGKIIHELKGKTFIEGAEWFEENDPEMLDWIVGSDYWGRGYDYRPNRSEAIIEIRFEERGTLYYADFESSNSNDEQPSQKQPPWGEDSWEDWNDIEQLKAYYKAIVQ